MCSFSTAVRVENAPSYREVVVLTYAANYLIPRHGLPRRV